MWTSMSPSGSCLPDICRYSQTELDDLTKVAPAPMLETLTSASIKAPTAAAADRILVVDDEPNICRLLQRSLGRLGYDVVTAGSVPEALDTLEGSRFDLVLTDLRLPGPSGLDLLVEVRTRAPGTRTMLMSAHADVYAASAAIDRGIDQLIVKDRKSVV